MMCSKSIARLIVNERYLKYTINSAMTLEHVITNLLPRFSMKW